MIFSSLVPRAFFAYSADDSVFVVIFLSFLFFQIATSSRIFKFSFPSRTNHVPFDFQSSFPLVFLA